MRPRNNVVIPTRHGMMIVNRNDRLETDRGAFGVGHDLLVRGEYAQAELEILAQMLQACPADPVVLDIGANIGVHTLFFADRVGAGGQVHAFEAQRIVFQMLMGNAALNSLENVHGYRVALGRAAGRLKLPPVDYSKPWNFGGMGLVTESPDPQFAHGTPERAHADHGETIPMITLDSLDFARVDFIKLDVEGMELDVLHGGRATIERDRPLMQVEWLVRDQGALPACLIDDFGYRVFQAGMNLLCIPAERGGIVIDGTPEVTLAGLRANLGTP